MATKTTTKKKKPVASTRSKLPGDVKKPAKKVEGKYWQATEEGKLLLHA